MEVEKWHGWSVKRKHLRGPMKPHLCALWVNCPGLFHWQYIAPFLGGQGEQSLCCLCNQIYPFPNLSASHWMDVMKHFHLSVSCLQNNSWKRKKYPQCQSNCLALNLVVKPEHFPECTWPSETDAALSVIFWLRTSSRTTPHRCIETLLLDEESGPPWWYESVSELLISGGKSKWFNHWNFCTG